MEEVKIFKFHLHYLLEETLFNYSVSIVMKFEAHLRFRTKLGLTCGRKYIFSNSNSTIESSVIQLVIVLVFIEIL